MELFDTKTGRQMPLKPLDEKRVGIYVCGPTVQSEPHIGHLRSALSYDILLRWLMHLGYQVTMIRNITDIDDKVIEKAIQEEQPFWQIAMKNEVEFQRQFEVLGLIRPSYEPRATGHIPEILEFIDKLLESKNAYVADGDVYFDVESLESYGELTNQNLEDLESSEPLANKKHVGDFALWKKSKSSEPADASWNSSFGPGRPGWHIECSAMAHKYLGETFDIHGGGLDLRFPHHENELAQSSAAGYGFASLWMHNGLVTVAGQKMSKSRGNSVFGSKLLLEYDPMVLRYYLLSAHYRSILDYQDSSLSEAGVAYERIQSFIIRATRKLADSQFWDLVTQGSPVDEFVVAMNDDLNTSKALAAIHDTVRDGNQALDDERLREAATALGALNKMLSVLGFNPEGLVASDYFKPLDQLANEMIEQRDQARSEKNFELADSIRDRLKQAGITLSDDADGTHWGIE